MDIYVFSHAQHIFAGTSVAIIFIIAFIIGVTVFIIGFVAFKRYSHLSAIFLGVCK